MVSICNTEKPRVSNSFRGNSFRGEKKKTCFVATRFVAKKKTRFVATRFVAKEKN